MSAAKPMGHVRRITAYLDQTGRRYCTPRQWQRIRHKWSRAYGKPLGHWGDKRKPTPRQIKRRPSRLERVA